MFEDTKNIDRGKWFSIVSENGGSNNAYTTHYVTNYYEVFPSNNLELGLWMEAERMLHLVINPIGVETQNEVVKEEKRVNLDSPPYAQILPNVFRNLFTRHPYRWQPIGSMEHLDAATLDEFLAFNQKFYVPNKSPFSALFQQKFIDQDSQYYPFNKAHIGRENRVFTNYSEMKV